jgi:hypothetical protein
VSGIDWARVDAAAQSAIDQDQLATAIESGLTRGQRRFLRRLVLRWVLATALVIALTSASFVARGARQSEQSEPVSASRVAFAVPPTSLPVTAGRTPSPAPSTSLPLQSRGLAINSDVQAAATSAASFPITPKQLDDLIKNCGEAVEIPAAGADMCGPAISRAVGTVYLAYPNANPGCPPTSLCIKFRELPARARFAGVGFLEVVDQRETGSQCDAAPRGVCMRIGIPTLKSLNTVLKRALPASPAGPAITSTTPTTPASGDIATAPPDGLSTAPPEGPPATSTPSP